jgi:hypothetical protein
MTNENGPAASPQPDRNGGVEDRDEPTKQAPGYNEIERDTGDTGGDTDQRDTAWRPGEDAAARRANTGMQGEGEPGRSERDSTGGVEG